MSEPKSVVQKRKAFKLRFAAISLIVILVVAAWLGYPSRRNAQAEATFADAYAAYDTAIDGVFIVAFMHAQKEEKEDSTLYEFEASQYLYQGGLIEGISTNEFETATIAAVRLPDAVKDLAMQWVDAESSFLSAYAKESDLYYNLYSHMANRIPPPFDTESMSADQMAVLTAVLAGQNKVYDEISANLETATADKEEARRDADQARARLKGVLSPTAVERMK